MKDNLLKERKINCTPAIPNNSDISNDMTGLLESCWFEIPSSRPQLSYIKKLLEKSIGRYGITNGTI